MTHQEPSGRVCVSIESEVSVEAAFDALVQPDRLARWFGTQASPMRSGAATRIEFGDGDFFAIDGISIEPPNHLSYEWRFLGLGGRNRIRWSVTQEGARSRVTVTDEHPGRSDREIEVMRDGWRDFLHRLSRYLATGENARYDWRRDIDADLEMALGVEAAAARLFHAEGLDRWQPWRATGWTAGARLNVSDGEQPSSLRLVELERTATEILLVVAAPEWQGTTRARVALASHPGGSVLSLSHTGWAGIDARDEVQRAQRQRFCGLWIDSLMRASSALGEP